MTNRVLRVAAGAVFCSAVLVGAAWADPSVWRYEWPTTDFSKTSVEFDEILSGGPPKDGIPAIDRPQYIDLAAVAEYAIFGSSPQNPSLASP